MNVFPIFTTAFQAIIPIVLVIGLGFLLKQKGFLTREFARVGNKLGFNVLMPIMLFLNVYSIESFRNIRWDALGFCMVFLMILFMVGYVTIGLTTKVQNRRGVILQNIFRSNVLIIGPSLAAALGNDDALVITSVVLAFSQPIMNVLAVVSLSIFSDAKQQKIGLPSILKKIAANPLIHSIAFGLICLALRNLQTRMFGRVVFSIQRDLAVFYTAMNNLKSITSPFMLLIMGVQFDFSAASGMIREIIVGTLWRVAIAPLFVLGTAIGISRGLGLMDFGPEVYPAMIALFASPTAISSAIMSGQMGHDEQLATQLVVWTSISSIATIFTIVCILMSMGLLVI